MTDRAVYRGIHDAVRALRDGRLRGEEGKRNAQLMLDFGGGVRAETLADFHWVPYVHYGV